MYTFFAPFHLNCFDARFPGHHGSPGTVHGGDHYGSHTPVADYWSDDGWDKLSPPANEMQVKAGAQSGPLSDNLRFKQKQKFVIFLIFQWSISLGKIENPPQYFNYEFILLAKKVLEIVLSFPIIYFSFSQRKIGLIRVTQADFKTFLIFNMNVMTDRKQFEHNRSSHRTISSLHSSVGLLDEDRKRVVLSVEGWSKFRTQHSSTDLNHWPVEAQRHSIPSVSGRELKTKMMWRWGKLSDLYLRSPWVAAAEVVSPGRTGRQTWIPPIDGPWRPGKRPDWGFGSIIQHPISVIWLSLCWF